MMKPLGILGGTFDPVHNGHLRIALDSMAALDLEGVRLIPAAVPPLREQPAAGADHRLRMLQLAIAGIGGLSIDERELRREGRSYTIDTLAGLRADLNDQSLCLIMGSDAFRAVNEWHRWEELLDHAHIIIVERPGTGNPPDRPGVAAFLARHLSEDPGILHQVPAGSIVTVPIPPLDISASRIREAVAAGRDIGGLTPPAVIDYIRQHSLYH